MPFQDEYPKHKSQYNSKIIRKLAINSTLKNLKCQPWKT